MGQQSGEEFRTARILGQHASVYFQSSTPQDFSTYAKGYLEFDIGTFTGTTDLVITIDCVCHCSSLNRRLTGRVTSEWHRVSAPISRLVSGGLELAYVDTSLVFWPADRVAVGVPSQGSPSSLVGHRALYDHRTLFHNKVRRFQ